MKKWIATILLIIPLFTNAQIITTFAGTGAPGLSGNGGLAIDAGIPHPCSGVFDKHGNYYFCETNNAYRVRKIDPAGLITTVAGNSSLGGYNGDNIQATAAQLNLPNAVTVDSLGNLFIADANNNRIRKVNVLTGIITTIAGTGIGGYNGDNIQATSAQLYDPQDMCFDKNGNLYIADLSNNRVRKIGTSGVITTYAGTGVGVYSGEDVPATAAGLTVWGLCVDDTNNLYISDRSFCRVRRVNTAGNITTIAGTGIYTYNMDDVSATTANIDPCYLSVNNGELFISDGRNNRIRKVDVSGIIHTIAGIGISGHSGDGGPATLAKLAHPTGVAFDTCGNIYVADNDSNYIRKIIIDTPCYLNVSSLSTNELNCTLTSIYPNPTNEVLHIDNTTAQSSYKIQNIVGATMQEGSLNEGNNTVQLISLPPGMYMLRVSNGGSEKVIRKIVKQ